MVRERWARKKIPGGTSHESNGRYIFDIVFIFYSCSNISCLATPAKYQYHHLHWRQLFILYQLHVAPSSVRKITRQQLMSRTNF